jgi:hypothetical protein
MKLLKEEKTESVQENRIYKLYVFLFLCSTFSFPQIPINGFCKLQSFQYVKSADSFYPCNFNNDAYTDILVIDRTGRKIYILEGLEGNDFKLKTVSDLPAGFQKLVLFNTYEMNEFCYTTAKSSKTGLLKINPNGTISYRTAISIDSNPGFINAFDTNRDSIPELLLSGPSTRGITVVKNYLKK